MADLNRYSPAFFEPDIVKDQSTLGEATAATIGLRVQPLVDAVRTGFRYGTETEPGYDFTKDLGNYELYAPSLAAAKNPQHMAELKRAIDLGLERRQTAANTSLTNQFVAGLADPINFIALPFGGPSTSFLRSAARVGAGVATIEATAEAVSAPFDPAKTFEESATNVLTGALFGAGLGGALSIPIARSARAFEEVQLANQEMFDAAVRLQNLEGMTAREIIDAGPREQRAFGQLEEAELSTRINALESDAQRLEAAGNTEQARLVQDQAKGLRQELGIRQIEDMDIDLNDPFNIKNSWFTNSVFYKAVSTPMKRVLQAKVPSKVKEAFVRSFGDSGITLAMNSVGVPSPQSVFQRAAVANGRWVQAHDELSRLWAADTGASPASRLDLNATDIARRASRSDSTYRQWLTNVSEKRIKGITDMSENELKAVSVINKYFEDAEARLREVGLLNDAQGMKRRIEMLGDEIASLQDSLNRMKAGSRARAMTEGRIEDLQSKRDMFGLMVQEPDASTVKDAFFPRFFDRAAIRARREDFSRILYNWFEQNPYTYKMKGKKIERVKLSTEPSKIQERVDQTIDRILGEADPTALEAVSFGVGRSKHFRSRELDIPNRLVSDFMLKDPLAVMKAYAARIEPRYEFAKQFGTDRDGVLFQIERDMIEAGLPEKEINKVLRDYRHMYNRVAGAVLENPDTLSQKAAFFLREAASFSYMGSSGLAALPDFGRILLEYDMENVVRGVQGILDRDRLNMTVDETRKAGEAIDILKGSAHMRMMEDLGNNIDSNELLSTARNAFYILNGLAPMTTIAKQLAGIIDAHTIIDYSRKLVAGKLDDQGIEWLARYGIGEDQAREIARAPYQQTENGLFMANTDAWTDINVDDVVEELRPKFRQSKKRVTEMDEKELVRRFRDEFFFDRVVTDKKIVEDVMARNGYPDGLGYSMPFGDMPNTIYLNFEKIKESFDRFKSATGKQSIDELRARLDAARERMGEEAYVHKTKLLDNVDLFDDADDFAEFILLHELHHTTNARFQGESLVEYEARIDDLTFDYIRNQRERGLRLAAEKETSKRVAEREELVLKFRTALNSGVLNTIMSGTPADKPIITDGVAYIPMSVASKFGMKEHPQYRGYARIENGLMGLPFQFYSFVLANVNKTVGALAHGQVKNRAIGISTMMGLAYMSLSFRTPDYIWDEMSWQDRFARSFDMSGVMALYSDLMYTSMHTSLALGGPNITGGLLQPKFKQEESVVDAATALMGAGPSWAYDTASGMVNFMSGNYAEGAKDVVRNMPFMRLWFLKDDVNQITNAWAN